LEFPRKSELPIEQPLMPEQTFVPALIAGELDPRLYCVVGQDAAL
jgi:hypothetical protein